MGSDSDLRNRYLDQYKDIYGENIYLSSLELVENRTSTIKGGSELTAFYHLTKDCNECIYVNSDINFSLGDEDINVIFIAESNSKESGNYDNPLTRESRQLFGKILSAIKLTPVDANISNVSNYTTTENFDQYQFNIKICEYHFQEYLQFINPILVVALGENLGNRILSLSESKEKLDDKIYEFENFNLMITHHLDAVLKNPNLKRPVWRDFKNIRDNYLN